MTTLNTAVETEIAFWVDRTAFLRAASLAAQPDFVARVSVALASIAQTAAAAYLGTTPTTQGKQQYLFAVTVLKDIATWAPRFAVMLVSLPSISRDSTDADLAAAIQANWSIYANVP